LNDYRRGIGKLRPRTAAKDEHRQERGTAEADQQRYNNECDRELVSHAASLANRTALSVAFMFPASRFARFR
jgi:hypothetical protein